MSELFVNIFIMRKKKVVTNEVTILSDLMSYGLCVRGLRSKRSNARNETFVSIYLKYNNNFKSHMNYER
jgi:hypothetical protein